MGHAALAGLATSFRLHGPFVGSDFRRRVTTSGAAFLLIVVRAFAASRAKAVRLLVALAHRRSAVSHGCLIDL